MELTPLFCSKDVLVALAVVLTMALLKQVWSAFVSMCWRPLRIKLAFEAQGIPTLPFHFLLGNLPELTALTREARRHPMPQISHDIAPRILPYLYHWAQKYGRVPYVYWFGSRARYTLVNAEDAKEVLSTKFGHYARVNRRPDAKFLAGNNGLVVLAGEKWAQRRRILNVAFFLDKLKAMIPDMEACTIEMMESWSSAIEAGQAIDVQKSLKDLTADIIAHTAFGSSFAEGRQVFELQNEQKVMTDKILRSVYIPGARFLPTAFNRRAWKVDRNIRRCLRDMVNMREEALKVGRKDSYGNDLLGLMMAANRHELEGNQKNLSMTLDDIIDECKTFYFAGHETTATLLMWTFLLLATNPEWQTRTREEVLDVCGRTDTPTPDACSHLRIMGMVLNETLRLYPPATMQFREAATDMQLGKVVIPKGAVVALPIISWHHDERYWGTDANEFRPERFSEGVGKASRVAGAFMPFSMGPRVCIGQNFALLEAKVVLCTILRRYRIRLSPAYQHAPITVLTLQPQYGMPILFEKV